MFCVVMLLVIGFFLFLAKKQREKRENTWRNAGQAIGFTYVEPFNWAGYPRLNGNRDGVPVDIDVVMRGSGKNKQVFTRATSPSPIQLPKGLKVTKEHLFDGFTKFLGGQDIEIGLPSIDDKLLIKGRDEEEVRQFFRNARVRQTCVNLVNKKSGGMLSHDGVQILVRNMLMSSQDIQGLIGVTVDIVKALEAATQQELT